MPAPRKKQHTLMQMLAKKRQLPFTFAPPNVKQTNHPSRLVLREGKGRDLGSKAKSLS